MFNALSFKIIKVNMPENHKSPEDEKKKNPVPEPDIRTCDIKNSGDDDDDDATVTIQNAEIEDEYLAQ